jgi:nudix-type nucleoside diphosphatase (YffH/AdpP family)
MAESRKAEIHGSTNKFKGFFEVDEVDVSHEQRDGTIRRQTREVFERGDSVAVLILNLDTESVVLVNQFKIPSLIGRRRDDPNTTDGWITEATAGMIDKDETPEQAIVREAKEETGYQIKSPKLISKFFSSPGGTSERIFLYFAEVRESDRVGKGGGLEREQEDITVVNMPATELFNRLDKGLIDDAKLAIGAYWLKDRVKAVTECEHLIGSLQTIVDDVFGRLSKGPIDNPKLAVARPRSSSALPFSRVCYALKKNPDLLVGYMTGPIKDMKNISLWVNSENTDMLMDRVFGRSISAQIRRMGSNKDEEGNIIEDTIAEALRAEVGPRGHVRIGTVLVTESGSLKASHQVERILHVASVQASPDGGVQANLDTLATCVKSALDRAEKINTRYWNTLVNLFREWFGFKPKYYESILIPTIGAGEGGLTIEDVTRSIIPAAIEHFGTVKLPTLKQVFFIAYDQRAKDACDAVLKEAGDLIKIDCA